MPRDTAKLGAEGICWARRFYDNPEGLPLFAGDDVGILFGETRLHSFLRYLGSDVFNSKTRELKRAAIVPAMYVTFDAVEDDARDFWVEVGRGGDEFEPKAPSTVLDKELRAYYETGEDAASRSLPTSSMAASSPGARTARTSRSTRSTGPSPRASKG